MNPMMMNVFAGFGVFVIFLYLVPFILLGLAIPYFVLRLRDARAERSDPQVGIKAGLYYFFSVGIMVLLIGLTVVVVDLLLDSGGGGPFGPPVRQGLSEGQRVGLAMGVSGLILTLLHLALVKLLTDDRGTATRRLFAGWRFAIVGLVVVFAFTGLVVVLFQKDFGTAETRKFFFGVLLVWFPAWIVHLILVTYYSRRLYEPSRIRDTLEPEEPA